jgi:hypothetical protein
MGNRWEAGLRWLVRALTVVFAGSVVSSTIAFAAPRSPAGGDVPPIVVTLDGRHMRPFQSYFFGANSGHLRNAFNWDDAEFDQALQNLRFLTTLRFPAGELANYWDWKSGTIGSQGNDNDKSIQQRNAYPAPLSELKHEISITHAFPLFVLNMLTNPVCGDHCPLTPSSPNLRYQMDMLDAARTFGINLDYLELGNEYYINKPNYEAVYPDPVSDSAPLASVLYARLATQWIHTIKEKYPQVKVAVVGADITATSTDRKAKWLTGLFNPAFNSPRVGGNGEAALQGADAVTLHVYPGPNLLSAPAIDANNAEDLFGEAFKEWNEIKANDLPLIPRNMPIWFTEFNLHGSDKVPVLGTWAHGLFVATLSMLFMEDSRVQMETHHELVGNAGFGDLFYTTNSFAHTDGGGKWVGPALQTKLWGESAMADTLEVLATASANADQAERLTFQQVPEIFDSRSTLYYPALYGWSLMRGSDRRLVILNLYNRQLTVNLAKVISRGAYEQVSGNPGTYVTGSLDGSPTNLTCAHGTLDKASSIVLPAFSITSVVPETSGLQ